MSTAGAWAVINSFNGEINVRSISPTRRAAIVNWLVVEEQLPIMALHSDEEIEEIWKHFGKHAECVQVTVTR